MDYKEPVTCLKYHSSQLGIFWIIFAKPTALWWDKKEFKKNITLGLESQNTNVVLDAGKFLVQYDNLLRKMLPLTDLIQIFQLLNMDAVLQHVGCTMTLNVLLN